MPVLFPQRQHAISSFRGLPSPHPNPLPPQVLKRVEYQALLEQFNRRMGRPLLSGEGGAAPARAPAAPGFSLPQMPRLQVRSCLRGAGWSMREEWKRWELTGRILDA